MDFVKKLFEREFLVLIVSAVLAVCGLFGITFDQVSTVEALVSLGGFVVPATAFIVSRQNTKAKESQAAANVESALLYSSAASRPSAPSAE
jgi:positive regulator of sigma E activity